MGSAEDQPPTQAPVETPIASAAGAGSPSGTPRARDFGASPQKTLPLKPKTEGPAFDFASADVLAAEAALREAAVALHIALQVAREDRPGESGYPALREAVDRALPPFHACYETYIRAVVATGESPIACTKGCGHCCSHYVSSVEPFELIRLHGRINRDPAYPSRLVAFHRRAALYRSLLGEGADEAADDRALYRYYLRDRRCPFLSAAGECGVYEDRPMTCRMFFSQSHPSLCRGRLTVSPGNRNFIVELPDDIEAMVARTSALLGDLGLSENLFEGLLETNALFGRFDGETTEGGP